MFTDMEDSTTLWERAPDSMSAALEAHDRLIHAVILEHEGAIFARGGDSFSAVFQTPDAGARAAVAIQSRLAALQQVRIRIGLHAGASYQREGNYFGLEINRTARIAAAGNGGQILLSARIASLVDADSLGCRLRDLGPHVLRGFAEPEPMFQLQPLCLRPVELPLRAAGIVRHNLPHQANSFVGREDELAEIQHLLKRAALVSLVGAGGCGKTRLAVECGWQALGEYKDGVWLIELAGILSEDLIPPALAALLGLKDDPERSPEEAVLEYLSNREVLLLVDNCEHLLGGVALIVSRILASCRKLRVLATTREPLGLTTEHVWRIPCLVLPPERCPAAEVAAYPASRLFLDRAKAASNDFTCGENEAGWIASICRHLDGIPLALELAAARVRALTVEQIDQRLNDRFRLLKSGSRGTWRRHQTLQAAFDWSYDLLEEDERVVFRRLAVFSGGLSLEAAEDVCADDHIDSMEVAGLLARLVDRCLVAAEPHPLNEQMRYRQLETVRQYAENKLESAGEFDALRTRHRLFYMGLAEQGEAELHGPNHGHWLDRLQLEQDNFRSALAWSVESDERLRLAGSLWRYWYQRGPLAEGRAWLEGALQRSVHCSPAARAKAYSGAGNLAMQQGDWEAARAHHLRSLDLRRSIGDHAGVSGSLNNLGLVARGQGDTAAARRYLEEALQICRELSDEARLAAALVNLWATVHEEGEDAPHLLEESRQIYERLSDPWRLAIVLHNLGWVHLEKGELAEALPLIKRSLMLHQEVRDHGCILLCLTGIAYIAAASGDLAIAARLLGADFSLREQEGIAVPVTEAPRRATKIEELRGSLGELEFDRHWASGGKLDLPAAVALASSWTVDD